MNHFKLLKKDLLTFFSLYLDSLKIDLRASEPLSMSLSNKCGSIAYFFSTLHYTTFCWLSVVVFLRYDSSWTLAVPPAAHWTNTASSKAGITVAIEDIHSTYNFKSRNRSTGVAISAALGLLECCFVNTGSRIMVFASEPGLVLDSDFWQSMRTHNDIYIYMQWTSCSLYKQIANEPKSMELLDLAHLLGKRTVTDQTCIAFFF